MPKRISQQAPNAEGPARPLVRCAIYTRKSTDEGLAQEFNSLDAQRECAEAYIQSQRHAGWVIVQQAYDDGGYSGGTMDRPALQRLLADIAAGVINIVVVYKVDRLSRSLLDFARIMEICEKYGVSFVSVTQQINTATSMGRLNLNVLLSFAQFEREMVSDRTRDKMSAARRKGKWVGGIPVLGYDVHRDGGRLVVNEAEAPQVRMLYDLYLERRSLMAVVLEANRRGICTKQRTSKEGRCHAAKPVTKNLVFRILTNVIYAGQVNHKGQIFPGEQARIVDEKVWSQVADLLRGNGISGGRSVRNRYGALLRGVLWCESCQARMAHTYTMKDGKRYRYYVCATAQQRGWDACPSKSVSAQAIEDSVLEKVRAVVTHPVVAETTVEEVFVQGGKRAAELATERSAMKKELGQLHAALARTAASSNHDSRRVARMAELQDRIRAQEKRMAEIQVETQACDTNAIHEGEILEALRSFEPVWTALTIAEQTRIVEAVVERINYDGRTGRISLVWQAAALPLLGRGEKQSQQVM
jgi:site-specific DNA recombinase